MSQKADSPISSTVSNTEPRTYLAFVFSLVGGILVTIGSVLGLSYAMMGRPFFWGMGGMMGGGGYSNFMSNMMAGYFSNGYNYSSGFYGMMTGFESAGLVAGLLVLIFAILMKSRPADRKTFGIVVLAFSVVSINGTGVVFSSV